MQITVYTDGSKRGKLNGYGVVIITDDWVYMEAGNIGNRTSNVAELFAIYRGCRLVRGVQGKRVLFSDSQYSINCVTKWHHKWRRNGWRKRDGKPVKNARLIDKITVVRPKNLSIRWVRGHNGNYGNELADRLAAMGLHLPHGKMAYVRRRIEDNSNLQHDIAIMENDLWGVINAFKSDQNI